MTLNANKALIRRYYDELWNAWRLELIEAIIAPGIRFRGSLGVDVVGREGFRSYVSMVRAAFPDFHNSIEELIAEGDRVAARLTYRGTHQGPILGVAPTGRQITYAGMAILRVEGGQIREGWVLGDRAGLLEQLSGGRVRAL